MLNSEFYERLQKFMIDNMGAFAKWNTDVGELNELMIEISSRLNEQTTKSKDITIYDDRAIDFAKNENYDKAAMEGVWKDLEKLREQLLDLYYPLVFYLNYYKADAPFLGWKVSDPSYQNMMKITEDINTLFLQIWVIVEKGLGNKLIFKGDN